MLAAIAILQGTAITREGEANARPSRRVLALPYFSTVIHPLPARRQIQRPGGLPG